MSNSNNLGGPSQISAPMLNSGSVISGPTQIQTGLGSYNTSDSLTLFNQNQSNVVTANSVISSRISMQG